LVEEVHPLGEQAGHLCGRTRRTRSWAKRRARNDRTWRGSTFSRAREPAAGYRRRQSYGDQKEESRPAGAPNASPDPSRDSNLHGPPEGLGSALRSGLCGAFLSFLSFLRHGLGLNR
jgi:hypothetical protein